MLPLARPHLLDSTFQQQLEAARKFLTDNAELRRKFRDAEYIVAQAQDMEHELQRPRPTHYVAIPRPPNLQLTPQQLETLSPGARAVAMGLRQPCPGCEYEDRTGEFTNSLKHHVSSDQCRHYSQAVGIPYRGPGAAPGEDLQPLSQENSPASIRTVAVTPSPLVPVVPVQRRGPGAEQLRKRLFPPDDRRSAISLDDSSDEAAYMETPPKSPTLGRSTRQK